MDCCRNEYQALRLHTDVLVNTYYTSQDCPDTPLR